jgi:hypothetical protein
MSLRLLVAIAWLTAPLAFAQTAKPTSPGSVDSLEREFFTAIRAGDSRKVLGYVPNNGVNVGSSTQHVTREEIETQFRSHKGLYCRLFDSSCIDTPIRLDNAAPTCSYRELLTHSDNVHTAGSEVTRGGVRQAVLVARVQNKRCPNDKLIDFIFNEQADGWKLFSIP